MVDVYRIGIEIALAGTIVQGLEIISAKLLGINKQVAAIENGFAKWGILAGGAAVAIGAGIGGALKSAADAGAALVDQQNQLRRLGIANNEVTALTAKYYSDVAAKVPTSTIVDYLSTVKELRAVTGDLASAEEFAPLALKMDAILTNVTGKETHGALYRLLRAGELKGIATDPQRLQELVEQAYKYIAAFGGKLTPEMLQSLAVRGGTAWMNADLSKSFGPMAVLAAEIGGGGGSSASAGVVLNQLQQLQLGSKTMTKQQFEALNTLGLIDQTKVSKTGFHGGTIQLQPGAIRGSMEHVGDVPGFARDVLWPALVKASTDASGKVDEAKLQSLLAKIAPTTNMAKAIELFGNPEFLKQQLKDLGLADLVLSPDAAYAAMLGVPPPAGYSGPHSRGRDDEAEAQKTDAEKQGNYLVLMHALQSQWTSLLQVVGGPLAIAAIPVLQQFTGLFTDLGKIAADNSEAIKLMGEALGGLALGLTALGSVAIIRGIAMLIPGGAVAVGIASLAATIGVMAAINWESVKTAAAKIGEFAEILGKGLASLGIALGKDALDLLASGLNTFKSDLAKVPADVRIVLADIDSSVGTIKAAFAQIPVAIKGIAGDVERAAAALPAEVGAAISSAFASIGAKISGAITGMIPGVGGGVRSSGGPHPRGGDYNPHGDAPPLISPHAYLAPTGAFQPYRAAALGFVPPPSAASSRAAQPAAPAYGGAPDTSVKLHIKAVTMLDGKVIAELVSRELARFAEFPRQAAYSDSYLAFNAPDFNYSTG